MKILSCLAVLTLAAGELLPAAHAYNATATQWAGGANIPLVIALGPAGRTLTDGQTSWDGVALTAAANWNGNLGLIQFVPSVDDNAVAQQDDGRSTVAFSDTIYGDSFGDETVAVTLLQHGSSNNYIGEADVLVNREYTFDSYPGPLRDPGTGQNVDLGRVLLHEFGHVLGLDHPDKIGQNVDAVMNSVIGDTDHLTADDLAGAVFIYGDPALRGVKAAAYGLTVESGREKIYVSTKNANGKGHLRVIDPYTAQIVASVSTGLKPGVLTESRDGGHLYLGLDQKGAIDQIDPDTLAVTQEIPLGLHPGTTTAAAIEVLPGAPESLLVSQKGNTDAAFFHHVSGSFADFAIYDNGKLRPEEEFDTYNSPGSPVIPDKSGATFYAFLRTFDGMGAGTASRFTVDAGGVAPTYRKDIASTHDLSTGAEYNDDESLLYGTDGSVLDLANGNYPDSFVGVLPGGLPATAIGGDGDLKQLYLAVPRPDSVASDHRPMVQVVDAVNHILLGAVALPRYILVERIDRWGTNGLLLVLSDKRILFIRTTAVALGSTTDVPETVTLGAPKSASFDENGAKDKLVVTRTDSDLSAPLTVRYTVGGTAVNGMDYRLLGGAVTIPAGAATAKIKIVPTGEHFTGGPRTVEIRLAFDAAFRWGATSAAVITLTDNG